MITLFKIIIPAWMAGIQASMDGFELTIHGTGYPLPGEYDEISYNLTK